MTVKPRRGPVRRMSDIVVVRVLEHKLEQGQFDVYATTTVVGIKRARTVVPADSLDFRHCSANPAREPRPFCW